MLVVCRLAGLSAHEPPDNFSPRWRGSLERKTRLSSKNCGLRALFRATATATFLRRRLWHVFL